MRHSASQPRTSKPQASVAPESDLKWGPSVAAGSRILLLALMLISGVAAWSFVTAWTQREWVTLCSLQIEGAAEAELPELMSRLQRVPTGGWPRLVQLLAHQRPEVRSAASAELVSLFDRLRTTRTSISPQIARLTHQIARLLEQGAEISPELAGAVLNWPIDTAAIDAQEYFADCRLIGEQTQPRMAARLRSHETRSPQAVSISSQDSDSRSSETSPPKVTYLLNDDETNTTDGAPPRPDSLEELEAPDRLMPELPQSPAGGARPVPDAEVPQRMIKPGDVAPLAAWEPLSDLEVMQQLHAENPEQIIAAAQELRRRGYEPHHLPLARSLTHADPEVRRELAEALPRIAKIDWRRWITPLLEDEDKEVRATARALYQAGDPGRSLR